MRSHDLVGEIRAGAALLAPWRTVDADRGLGQGPADVLDALAELRSAVDVIELRALAAHAAEDHARVDGFRDSAHWWAARTGGRISKAKDRVALARRLFTGDLGDTAMALVGGLLSVDQARAIHQVTRRMRPQDAVQVERIILEAAAVRDGSLTVESIGSLGAHVRSLLADEETVGARWERQQVERTLVLVRLDDGWHVEGFLTDEVGARLEAQLRVRSAPVGPEDGRTHGMRQHDALEALLVTGPESTVAPADGDVEPDDAAGVDALPAAGLVAVELVITPADVERIRHPATGPDHALARQCCTAGSLTWTALHHPHLRPRDQHGCLTGEEQEVLREALGRIAPALGGIAPDILNHGRRKRCGTPAQRRAAARRDKGCVFPGCTAPPHWCQLHHVREDWVLGGDTDLDGLALLCVFHHHLVHEGGWALAHTPERQWTATRPPAPQTGRRAA